MKLSDAIDGWLAERPMTLRELAERAVATGLLVDELDDEGFGPVDEVEDVISRSDAYWTRGDESSDGEVVLTRTFLETGMTLTHRVTEEEAVAGAVAEMPDLSVVLFDRRDGLLLDDASGRVVADDSDPRSPSIVGPEGWIERVQPGDLLAFTRTDGVLSVEVVDEAELGDGAAEIDALRGAAANWIGAGRGEEETPVVMEAMARDASLFRRPVPPLGELLDAAGYERRGHEWGRADEPWRTRQERAAGRDEEVRRRYGLEGCCDRAYARVDAAWRLYLRAEPVDGAALADDLGHGMVAPAFAHVHEDVATLVAEFADELAGTTSGRHAAPAVALAGLGRLRAGDPEGAVARLDAAVAAAPDLEGAAATLAVLEMDRGNVSRARSLVAGADVELGVVELVEDEQRRRAALVPSAGRNDPCPCGSGRKFKKCCGAGGGAAAVSGLAARVPLVLQRLGHFALGPDGHPVRVGLALSASDGHDDVLGAMERFLFDPFLVDVALHEGGLGDAYLAQRGVLLEADEVALIEVMLVEPRRVWEIVEVVVDESLTLRDTGSGDVVVVRERAGTRGREVGELLLARVAEVAGGRMMFGVPVVVPLRERERVLAVLDEWVDADGLASWFGSLFLPPRLQTREGEELVLRLTVCELVGDVASEVVEAALDDAFERAGEEPFWREMATVDGGDRIVRGTVRMEEGVLVVESTSVERQERILATLDGVFDYVVVEDEEADLRDAPPDRDVSPGPAWDELPAEVQEVVAAQMAEYEERWVDEPVPALGGLTPREALDDPTRREDLIALLREMRAMRPPDGAVGMSADRIEGLLGIDE
ncbi:YecA family protein [Actinomarinicola tropica]|uniref:DUF2384 domain-containing protein n=1 Tax=Actinomarinicola tropica TaxID=2789776 RepID=A0A5Q2RBX2_9ACTN|nr:SEC-C metal-binding domain-containing protein [Actinomarinicola tropica]QGG94338.1 hypothetical protein GH723_04045 [Actinomarinicola tropica]